MKFTNYDKGHDLLSHKIYKINNLASLKKYLASLKKKSCRREVRPRFELNRVRQSTLSQIMLLILTIQQSLYGMLLFLIIILYVNPVILTKRKPQTFDEIFSSFVTRLKCGKEIIRIVVCREDHFCISSNPAILESNNMLHILFLSQLI